MSRASRMLGLLALIALVLAGCGPAPTTPSAPAVPTTPASQDAPTTPAPQDAPTTPVVRRPTARATVTPSSPDIPAPTATATHSPTPTEPPAVPLASSEDAGAGRRGVRLTIVYDNVPYDARLQAQWGFAAWIEVGPHVLLFDTGGDGPVLLHNLHELGLDPAQIEAIVLSHAHGDHVGGLLSLLDTGIAPPVYAPSALPSDLVGQIEARTVRVASTGAVEVVPGAHTTGELGDQIVEQALVIGTPQGSVVVTGCAHPGVVDIVRRAREVVPGEVALLVGGFHLAQQPASMVAQIIDDLRGLDVVRVCPTHCTGEAATAAFATAYGDGFVAGGVGRAIEIDDPARGP